MKYTNSDQAEFQQTIRELLEEERALLDFMGTTIAGKPWHELTGDVFIQRVNDFLVKANSVNYRPTDVAQAWHGIWLQTLDPLTAELEAATTLMLQAPASIRTRYINTLTGQLEHLKAPRDS